jgi:hypothetical protein
MRKLWLLIGVLAGLSLALTACGNGVAGKAVTPATLVPIGRTPTSPPVAATPGLLDLPTSVPATCTVSSQIPTPGPTEESLFPGVSQADWRLGPDGAKVVFIEYSDFQ